MAHQTVCRVEPQLGIQEVGILWFECNIQSEAQVSEDMAELLLSLGALDNEAAPSEERDACALAEA